MCPHVPASPPGTFKAVLNSWASKWAAGFNRATTSLSRLPETAACSDVSRSWKGSPGQRVGREGEAQACVEVWEDLAGFHLRPKALSPRLTRGQRLACSCCTPGLSGGFSSQSAAPGKSEGSHLFGTLLEGSGDDLPLLSAPIGQHVHNGIAIYT